MIDEIYMNNSQPNNHKHENNHLVEDFIWVNKHEIKSLYSKLIDYEKKIMLYKEILKKNMINE